MDVLPVDRRRELCVLVEPRFPCPPVVSVEPVIDETPDVRHRHSIVRAIRRLAPTRSLEPSPKVVEVPLRDIDAKRADGVVIHGGSPFSLTACLDDSPMPAEYPSDW